MASPPPSPAVQSIGNLTRKIALSFKNDAVDISLNLLSKGNWNSLKAGTGTGTRTETETGKGRHQSK